MGIDAHRILFRTASRIKPLPGRHCHSLTRRAGWSSASINGDEFHCAKMKKHPLPKAAVRARRTLNLMGGKKFNHASLNPQLLRAKT